MFKYFDRDGNGTLSQLEFTKSLSQLGCYFNDTEIDCLFKRFDTNRSGKIDYEEFAGFMALKGSGLIKGSVNGANVRPQFTMKREEPHQILEKLRSSLRAKGMHGTKNLTRMFKKHDADGNGGLDRHEAQWLLK